MVGSDPYPSGIFGAIIHLWMVAACVFDGCVSYWEGFGSVWQLVEAPQ